MKTMRWAVMIGVLVLAGCGDSEETPDEGGNGTTANAAANNESSNGATNNASKNNASANNAATNNASTNNAMTTGPNNGEPNNGEPNNNPAPCDFEAVVGVLAFEAESLPINEEWEVASEFEGFDGDGYIVWTGDSHNNDPTNGVMSIDIRITEPGRYQLDWRVRIGMGTNTTEHNDAWVRFPDAADFYGLKGEEGAEVRRYRKPICDDADAMAAIEAIPEVMTASCAEGSTRDGWMKVYSSGANDWRWSARTSDNDASIVTVEFGEAGVYTMELAARADFFLIDRVLLRQESIGNEQARSVTETSCN